jgi:hypothetical protein
MNIDNFRCSAAINHRARIIEDVLHPRGVDAQRSDAHSFGRLGDAMLHQGTIVLAPFYI